MKDFNDEQLGDFKIDYTIIDPEIRDFIRWINNYMIVRRTTSSCAGHTTKNKAEMYPAPYVIISFYNKDYANKFIKNILDTGREFQIRKIDDALIKVTYDYFENLLINRKYFIIGIIEALEKIDYSELYKLEKYRCNFCKRIIYIPKNKIRNKPLCKICKNSLNK